MNPHKTTTPTLPELRVYALPEYIINIEFRTLCDYIERMYEGYYKVIWTETKPHLKFALTRHPVPIPIAQKLKYQRSLLIFWTAEPILPHKTFPDHSFSFYPDTATNTWFPDMLNVLYDDFVAFLNNKLTQRALTYRQTPKTNFCAFVQRYKLTTQSRVRNRFCAELMKYKKVSCPGPVMNNVLTPEYMQDHATDYSHGLVRYLSECKFFICFENQISSKHEPNGYRFVTQKILSAFIAGSIPIYSGYREIAELFNPAAFINAHDFSSHQELIEYIKEVDNSPELTAAYQNAPPILPDSPLHNRHPDKMRPLFLSLAERALERAAGPPILQSSFLRHSYYTTLFNVVMRINLIVRLARDPGKYLNKLTRDPVKYLNVMMGREQL